MTDLKKNFYLYFKAGCLIPSAITNCLIFCLFHNWVKRVSALKMLLCVSSVDFLFIVLLLPVFVPDLPDSFLSSIVNHFSCVLHRRLDSIHPDINKTILLIPTLYSRTLFYRCLPNIGETKIFTGSIIITQDWLRSSIRRVRYGMSNGE